MQAMTYSEMRQLEGSGYVCAISVLGFAAAEYGLVVGFASGGIGFGIGVIGLAVALYGVMAGC